MFMAGRSTAQSHLSAESFLPKAERSLKKIEFYPNPSRGSFKINIHDNDIEEIKLTVYDLNGVIVFEKVLSGLFPGVSMDMKLRKPGLYLVKIDTGNENIIEKLLIKA